MQHGSAAERRIPEKDGHTVRDAYAYNHPGVSRYQAIAGKAAGFRVRETDDFCVFLQEPHKTPARKNFPDRGADTVRRAGF
jgi:hypothetical protein